MDPATPTNPKVNLSQQPAKPEGPDVKALAKVLAMPERWRMLRALAAEGPMPVGLLGRRARCAPAMATKHVASLKKHGLVVSRHRNFYALAPGLVPEPGAKELRLGPCRIDLEGWD